MYLQIFVLLVMHIKSFSLLSKLNYLKFVTGINLMPNVLKIFI
jgi:hypothetical protein